MIQPVKFTRHYSWEVYHIENYLLDSNYIFKALQSINVTHQKIASQEKIDNVLNEIASRQIGKLVSHKVRKEIGLEITEQISLNVDPNSEDIGADLHESIVKSRNRINDQLALELNIEDIRKRVKHETDLLKASLSDGEWRKNFRGRDILRVFAGENVQGMQYVYFRDLIISQMANSGYQPKGMKDILDKIVSD